MTDYEVTKEIDCIGLMCPMPLLETRKNVNTLEEGEILKVIADDPATKQDIPRFCKRTGHELLELVEDSGEFHYYIKKK